MLDVKKVSTVLEFLDIGLPLKWPVIGHTVFLAENGDLAIQFYDDVGRPIDKFGGFQISLACFMQDCQKFSDADFLMMQAHVAFHKAKQNEAKPRSGS